MINWKKLFKSFKYAAAGIQYGLRRDQNLRTHFFIGAVVVLFGIFFNVTSFEMGLLGIVIILVICIEMVNSAIEEMVDLITNEHRKEAEIAKDLSAGMVLLSVIGAVIIGVFVFFPYIVRYISPQ